MKSTLCLIMLVVVASVHAQNINSTSPGTWAAAKSSRFGYSSSGPVSHWPANGNANDAVGTNHGTMMNGATFAVGRIGQAFSFDGLDDFVFVPASSNWAFGTGDFTVDFWMYGSTNDDRRPLINNRRNLNPGNENMWAIEIYNVANRVEFHSGRSILLTATNLLTSSSWNYIAVTRSSSTLSIYINGVLSGSVSNSNDFSEINDLQIGRDILPLSDLGGKSFQGLIDEVAIFNRALTSQEVSDRYNAAPPLAGAGNSLRFNHDTFVRVVDSPSLDINSQITIEAWIYKTWNGEDWNIIASKPWNSDNNPWHVYRIGLTYAGDVPKRAIFTLALSGVMADVWGTSVIPNNAWIHLAATYDGVQMKIYVNGILEGTLSASGTISTNDQPFVIGKNLLNHWNDFFGYIDEVRLWNVARTQEQIRANMHKVLTESESGLVGYWRFDEGSGTSTLDHSANGNNGTLFNNPLWTTSTAPFGAVGAFVNTTAPTSVGPSGGQMSVTITSTPSNANNLGIYQFGSLSGEPVTGESYPADINKRSNIVWGITERGSVTANLVFDYSNVGGIGTPSTIKLLKRTDASSAIWTEVTLSSRDDVARTMTVTGVTDFSEFALGAGSDNPLPIQLASFTASVVNGNNVHLEWMTISEVNNYGLLGRAQKG